MKPNDVPPTMPPGIKNAYWFAAFNSMSFSLVNGPLMILYFKHLGATSTILGILASLSPILNILQIPAAHFVEKVGYRAFVLKGWTARSGFILLMTGVIFLPDAISKETRIVLMLFLLLGYNTMRGISVCGLLPWISRLVPERILGKYLSFDQISVGLAGGTINLIIGVFLLTITNDRAIGWVLLFSFIAAIVSLFFLKRIPDVPVSREIQEESKPSWREMFSNTSFMCFMRYTLIIHAGYAAAWAFWAPFMRDTFHASDTAILTIVAFAVFINVSTLFLFGHRIDHIGSRPMLYLSGFLQLIHFLGWALMGAGVLPYILPMIGVQCFTSGVAGALFALANTKLAMITVPERGRSHFLAYFSVMVNLAVGTVPVIWGLILDTFHSWSWNIGGYHFTSYSIMFIFSFIMLATALVFLRKVTEPKAISTEAFFQELFIHTPRKVLGQIFFRRPYQG
jgi:MFS family permease